MLAPVRGKTTVKERSYCHGKSIMIKLAIKSAVRKFGYDIVRHHANRSVVVPPDFENRHVEIIEKVRPYTITSNERIYALIESVRYIVHNDIKGDLLECGVYLGGSMMTVALTLMAEGVTDRELYLFDTYDGMPAPDERDVDYRGRPAMEEFLKNRISDVSSTWVNASLESVRDAMALTGYPKEKIHFVKGLVEDTIPQKAPETIALIRLDTDWYQSTLHEMTHLYPRLSPKGIVLVDDYGHFKGSRQAVDEYF